MSQVISLTQRAYILSKQAIKLSKQALKLNKQALNLLQTSTKAKKIHLKIKPIRLQLKYSKKQAAQYKSNSVKQTSSSFKSTKKGVYKLFFNSSQFFNKCFKGGIYVIPCLPLNKHYIGQTCNFTARFNKHKRALRQGIHEIPELQVDFNFYGEDNFTFNKLYYGADADKQARLNFETLIIQTLPEKSRYNKYVSKAARTRIGNSFYGKRHTPEARLALSLRRKGQESAFKGHKQSNEVKQLISQMNKGKSSKERRKPLYIDGTWYESVSDASAQTGLDRRIIRHHCNSTEEQHKDFQWDLS